MTRPDVSAVFPEEEKADAGLIAFIVFSFAALVAAIFITGYAAGANS